MSQRKSTVFYGILIAFVSVVVGMVIASRLDLAPAAAANLTMPATNSAPLSGPIDATTFRTIAHDASPSVVSIITTSTAIEARRTSATCSGAVAVRPVAVRQRPPAAAAAPAATRNAAGRGQRLHHRQGRATSSPTTTSSRTRSRSKSGCRRMSDGEYGLNAKVIGRDALTDTALLQLTELPKDALVPAKFGDSAQMAPGDWVVAIGNPFDLSNTVTVGVVSAVGRQNPTARRPQCEDFIQTDAAINPGNSGGPLLNLRGEVIGINTMIVTDSRMNGGNVGVAFAMPINTVRDLLPQLRTGKVTRGRIGVSLGERPFTEEYARELGLARPEGAEVRTVERGAPADQAGMKARRRHPRVQRQAGAGQQRADLRRRGNDARNDGARKVMRDKKAMTLNVKVGELDLAERGTGNARRQCPARPAAPNQQKPTSA